ncbi:MAG: cyclic nucleotide-binding domain-containing protein [Pirellulales bacterium]|nr:cyclic nucleotide-binding domain-containing protein [Pirellulales bacterium]
MPVSPADFAKLSFAENLSPAGVERLAAIASERAYPAGTVVFREGRQNEDLMFICSGGIALDMRVPRRGEVRIQSLGPGDLLAWSALLGQRKMTATATALEATRVFAIPASAFQQLCQADPELGYQLMHAAARALANRLVCTRLQLLDLFAETMPAKST